MRRWKMSIALLLLPALLRAQQGPGFARPQLRCGAYDSLMAGVKRSDPGAASSQGLRGTRFISVQGNWSMTDQDRGITGVDLTVRADSGVGVAAASVQVMVHVTEQFERPLPERQGVLVLDDSTSIDLGSLAQTTGADFPNGVKTWYLYGPAPRGSLLALARATKIELRVGSTRWPFPDRLLQNIRGGLAAFVCQR